MSFRACEEVRRFFDEEVLPCLAKTHGDGFREWQIFKEVFSDTPATREKFLRFLHDVSTCPPEVMSWCKRQLSPRTTRNQKQGRGIRFIRKDGRLCRIRVVQGGGYAFRTKP